MKRWEAERIAERKAIVVTTRCAHCDWTVEGPMGETSAAHLAHRLSEHPEIRPPARRQRNRPSGQFNTEKTLDDNIAAVRQQGGGTWDGATA